MAKDPYATAPTVQPSADVFSLSYALVEVMTGHAVCADDPCDHLAFAQRVTDDHVRPQLPADDKCIPSAFVAMIHDMWQVDADARPTVSQLVPRLRDMCGCGRWGVLGVPATGEGRWDSKESLCGGV